MEAASDLLLFRIPPPLASQGSIFKIALFHNGLKADYTFWRLCSAVGTSGHLDHKPQLLTTSGQKFKFELIVWYNGQVALFGQELASNIRYKEMIFCEFLF